MSIETSLSYAALILADADLEISSENLKTLVDNANVEVESIWTNIYAKALEGKNLKDLFFNVSGGSAAAPSGSAAGAAAGSASEEAAAESEPEAEESDDDMGMGLFD